jgi:hypothetical protein
MSKSGLKYIGDVFSEDGLNPPGCIPGGLQPMQAAGNNRRLKIITVNKTDTFSTT